MSARRAGGRGRGLVPWGLAILVALATGACRGPRPEAPGGTPDRGARPDGAPGEGDSDWHVLLDPARGPAALAGWRLRPFGEVDPAEVRPATAARPAHVRLPVGVPLAGLVLDGEPPTEPYRLEVRARRLSGTDFFCATTFPVGDAHLTAVLGGWGGATCGLSCLDGADAARNATTTYRGFPDDVPVILAVEVDATEVRVFVDGEPLCATGRAGRRLGLRPEVLPTRPLGISSFAGAAAIEGVRWRPLAEGP